MPVFEDDPFGKIKEEKKSPFPSPREVNIFHTNSDVDDSVFAIHHTLGIKHNQASTGDHVHDGLSSRKIGAGMSLTVTGSKGANAALISLLNMLNDVIEFTDTTS